MTRSVIVFIVVGICVASAVAGKVELPEGFKICSRSDPNIEDCMKKAAKINLDVLANGYAPLDFPGTNPLHLDELEFSIGGEDGGRVSFTVKLTDILGLYEIDDIDEFKMNHDTKELTIIERLKFLTINATHASKGRLFIGQINGKGKCTVTLEEPTLSYHIKYSIAKRDDDEYIHVDSLQLKVAPKRAHGYFENMIGRDKSINDSLNKAVNENWKLIYAPIYPKIEAEFEKILKERMNLFFEKVPYDQLFPA